MGHSGRDLSVNIYAKNEVTTWDSGRHFAVQVVTSQRSSLLWCVTTRKSTVRSFYKHTHTHAHTHTEFVLCCCSSNVSDDDHNFFDDDDDVILVDHVGVEVANQSNSGLQHSSALGAWVCRAD